MVEVGFGPEYSTRDVVELTGLKRSTVDYLAYAGVIGVAPVGTGHDRQFTFQHVIELVMCRTLSVFFAAPMLGSLLADFRRLRLLECYRDSAWRRSNRIAYITMAPDAAYKLSLESPDFGREKLCFTDTRSCYSSTAAVNLHEAVAEAERVTGRSWSSEEVGDVING